MSISVATHDLQMRLDRSVPMLKLEGFPRFLNWQEAEVLTVSEPSASIQPVMGEDLLSLSPRWDTEYIYGVTTQVGADGNPVFHGFPHGRVAAEDGVLSCTLQSGRNYIRVERTGGTLRDWKAGEPVIGTSICSKAKVSGYLILERP